ncbi:unnamed protein product [Schistocephalus solidus]|uniref:Transmembrane protein 144 n=1 Tax=Schistocephalus solidus TaxID=70667 RepID=A0A183T2P2_SCHSO|nr:unnamed protein product [Schistocephalus solidus]
MGTAIMFVSLIVNCAVGSPQFYPLAMVGGALWGTGNALMITVIDAIGVGLGMLIASVANMLCGFASSRFGWFDIPAKIPSNPIMNYVGVGIAVGSVLIYAAIKPNRKEENEEEISTDEEHDNMSDRVIMSLKEIESESALVDELDPEKCRQDDGLVHILFDVQVNIVAIPEGSLQPVKVLATFNDALSSLVINSRVA